MLAPSKPVLSLTAADVMSHDVVALPQSLPLRAAARVLSEAHISGAPVVDEDGRCVGVLSTTDLHRWCERAPRPLVGDGLLTGYVCEWEVSSCAALSGEQVRGYMTRDPVTVAPDTPVTELARMMIEADIHRVIVVDADARPIGIVSGSDILAALAFDPVEVG
jgi:CBS domain-containing protein